MNIYKVVVGAVGAFGWPVCWTGKVTLQKRSYCIVASGFPDNFQYTRGAKGDAELIAALLNWFYSLRDDEQALFEDVIAGKQE